MVELLKIVNRLPLVFSLTTFSIAIGKPRKHSAVYLKKLVDYGVLKRLMRGLYARTSDPVLIAGNFPFPSYITGQFALFYWGEGEAPTLIDVATTEYHREIRGMPIRFHITRKLGKFKIASYMGYSIKIATREQAKRDIRRFRIL